MDVVIEGGPEVVAHSSIKSQTKKGRLLFFAIQVDIERIFIDPSVVDHVLQLAHVLEFSPLKIPV